jgi:hypothetical protein
VDVTVIVSSHEKDYSLFLGDILTIKSLSNDTMVETGEFGCGRSKACD